MNKTLIYQQLVEQYNNLDSEVCNKEIIANKMNNPEGFTDTRWIRIVNAKDNSVIELVDNKLFTKAEDPAREEFQTFQSNLTDGNRFEIRSQHQTDKDIPMVWDFSDHRKLLIQTKQKRKARRSNQNWISEMLPGPGAVSNFLIISSPECNSLSNFCLMNMGVDQQVQVVSKTDQILGDKAAHWKIVMLESTGQNVVKSQVQHYPQTSRKRSSVPTSPVKSKCSLI